MIAIIAVNPANFSAFFMFSFLKKKVQRGISNGYIVEILPSLNENPYSPRDKSELDKSLCGMFFFFSFSSSNVFMNVKKDDNIKQIDILLFWLPVFKIKLSMCAGCTEYIIEAQKAVFKFFSVFDKNLYIKNIDIKNII